MKHPMNLIGLLYGFGVVCGTIAIVSVKMKFGANFRQLRIFENTMGMCFAWCTLFATRWLFIRSETLESLGAGQETMSGRLLLANMLSAAALGVIFVLDYLEDNA